MSGEIPDRLPTRLRTTVEAQKALENYLGLQGEELLERLGVDFARISFIYNGPEEFGGEGIDMLEKDIFGIERVPVQNEFGTYYEISVSPLANATTVEEVENHPWPSADWFDYKAMSAAADEVSPNSEPPPSKLGGF